MTDTDHDRQLTPSGMPPPNSPHQSPRSGFWIRELPFTLLLLLTLGGVGYVSFSKQPIFIYWDILAPLIGLLCIWYGWPHAHDGAARLRLVITQLLHWVAFLLVMNILFLTSVQRVLTAPSTGLAIYTLLALGTFTGGLHVLSWQVCLLGLIMALSIPAVAWAESSALLLLLLIAALVVIGTAIWLHWRARGRRIA